MKLNLFIMLSLSGYLNAANLKVNGGYESELTGVTAINCAGVTINHESSTECCAGNTCSTESNRVFQNPAVTCPKIVLDGYEHTLTGDLQIIHQAKLIQGTTNIRSCRKPDNSFPTAGSFNELNIATNNVYFGVANMEIDVDQWIVFITSLDGNLKCTNGVLYDGDSIFKNGFEQE